MLQYVRIYTNLYFIVWAYDHNQMYCKVSLYTTNTISNYNALIIFHTI